MTRNAWNNFLSKTNDNRLNANPDLIVDAFWRDYIRRKGETLQAFFYSIKPTFLS